jgi:hypothetical protein
MFYGQASWKNDNFDYSKCKQATLLNNEFYMFANILTEI